MWLVDVETTELIGSTNETRRLTLFFDAYRLFKHEFRFGLQQSNNSVLLKSNLKKMSYYDYYNTLKSKTI